MKIPLTALAIFSLTCILVTGFWPSISTTILPHTTWGLYSREFFENVLIEAHGAVIDLLVVGVILYWFELRRDNKENVSKQLEILADLRFYSGSDSSYRVLGTVRRLLALGVSNLHLSEMQLNNVELKGLQLKNCNLHAAIFKESLLSHLKFEECKFDAAVFVSTKFEHVTLKSCTLRRAKFNGAVLAGLDFTSCELQDADFTNAKLRSANFRGVDCKGMKFHGADLRSANFIDARNLDPQALFLAKSLKSLKTNDPQIQSILSR